MLSYGPLPATCNCLLQNCSLDPVKKKKEEKKAQQPVQHTWAHYVSLYWSIHTATTGQVIAVVRDLVAVIIFVYIDVVLEFQSADVGFPLVMTQSIRDDSKQMWLWFPCLLTQEFTSTSLIFPIIHFCRSPRPTMVLSCFKWAEGVLKRGKCENEFILKEYFGLNASERRLWQKIIWICTSTWKCIDMYVPTIEVCGKCTTSIERAFPYTLFFIFMFNLTKVPIIFCCSICIYRKKYSF